MSARTSPVTEDRIAEQVEHRPGETAYEYGRRLRMVPRTVSAVLGRLEEAGRVSHVDVRTDRSRRLWYPTWKQP